MASSFSIESYIREYHRQRNEIDAANKNAVVAVNDIDINDYLSFLNPPGDIADVQKYVADHPAVELRELISVHEPVECKNLINTGVVDSVERRLMDDFDFHLLDFNFDIRRKKNFSLRSVAVAVRFNEPFPPHLRPRVISLFPDHAVFGRTAKVSGKVAVSGGRGFRFFAGAFDPKKDAADTDFIYDYAAECGELFSAQTGSGFFYKFFVPDAGQHTRSFRAMAILLRPRAARKMLMKASFVVNEFPVEYDYVTDLQAEESRL